MRNLLLNKLSFTSCSDGVRSPVRLLLQIISTHINFTCCRRTGRQVRAMFRLLKLKLPWATATEHFLWDVIRRSQLGEQDGRGIGHLKCKLRANYGKLASSRAGEQVPLTTAPDSLRRFRKRKYYLAVPESCVFNWTSPNSICSPALYATIQPDSSQFLYFLQDRENKLLTCCSA